MPGYNFPVKTDKLNKTEMAKIIFQSLYGNQSESFNWINCITDESGFLLSGQNMNQEGNPKPEDVQNTAYGLFAAFFDKNPEGRLQIFVPKIGGFRYIYRNSETGLYEIDEMTAPPFHAIKDKSYVQRAVATYKQFQAINSAPDFEQQTKPSKDIIDAEYKRMIGKAEKPEEAAPEDEDKMLYEPVPSFFYEKKDVERWDPASHGNGRKLSLNTIPRERLNDNIGKIMAAQVLLTSLFGDKPKVWDGAVLSDTFRKLPEQPLLLDNRYRTGTPQKTIEGKIAGFFDANPKGSLIIFSPKDSRPHRLTVNGAGAFVISEDPVIAEKNDYEKKQYNDFITENQTNIASEITNREEYKAQTSEVYENYIKPGIKQLLSREIPIPDPVQVKPLSEISRAKEPFADRINELYDNISELSEDIVSANNDIAFDVKKILTNIQFTVKKIKKGPDFINPDEAESFRSNIDRVLAGINAFTASSKNRKLSAAEKQLAKSFDSFVKEIKNPAGVISEIQRGLDLFENFHKEYHLHNKDMVNNRYYQDNVLPMGKRPSIEQLRSTDLAKTDPKEVMNTIIWSSVNDYMCSRMVDGYIDKQPSYFRMIRERLLESLSDAPFDIMMEYVNEFRAMEMALSDRAYKIYQDALSQAPSEMNGQQKELYAAKKLHDSPEFLAYNSLNKFKSDIASTPFATALVMFKRADADDPLRVNLDKREKSIFIGKLVNGGLDRILTENGVETESGRSATNFEKGTYPPLIHISGFDKSNPYMDLAEDYEELMKDTEAASASFTNMRDSMKALMSLDCLDAVNSKDFGVTLSNALKYAEEYRKSHNRFHVTDNGDKRFNLSARLSEKLKAAKDHFDKTVGEYLEIEKDPDAFRKKIADRMTEEPITFDAAYQDLASVSTNISFACYYATLKGFGIRIADTTYPSRDFFNAVVKGARLEELKRIPGAEKPLFAANIDKIYRAARIDAEAAEKSKVLISETLKKVKFTPLPAPDKTEDIVKELKLNKFSNQKNADQNRELAKKYYELLVKDTDKVSREFNSNQNRWTNCCLTKPGLSEEEKSAIIKKSESSQGRIELMKGIIREVMSLDLTMFENLSPEKFLENYQYIKYIHGITFDYTYATATDTSKELNNMFTEDERKKFEDIRAFIYVNIDNAESKLKALLNPATSMIDLKKLSLEQLSNFTNDSRLTKDFHFIVSAMSDEIKLRFLKNVPAGPSIKAQREINNGKWMRENGNDAELNRRLEENPAARKRYEEMLKEREPYLNVHIGGPNFISERELKELALDEEFAKVREKAKHRRTELYEKRLTLSGKIKGDATTIMVRGLPWNYDMSGTKDAEEANLDFADMLSSPEGKSIFGKQMINRLAGIDGTKIYSDSLYGFIDMADEMGVDSELGFIANSVGFDPKSDYVLNDTVKDFYKYNKVFIETAGTSGFVSNYYGSSACLLFKPTITSDEAKEMSVLCEQEKISLGKEFNELSIALHGYLKEANTHKNAVKLFRDGELESDFRYYKAFSTDENGNKTRIPLNEALELYGTQGKNISFEKMSEEDQKKLDEAFKNPFTVIPVPAPGALGGDGLKAELVEMAEFINTMGKDYLNNDPQMVNIQNAVKKASQADLNSKQVVKEQLRIIKRLCNEYSREHLFENTPQGIYRDVVIKAVVIPCSRKLGIIAAQDYCTRNKAEMPEINYTEKQPLVIPAYKKRQDAYYADLEKKRISKLEALDTAISKKINSSNSIDMILVQTASHADDGITADEFLSSFEKAFYGQKILDQKSLAKDIADGSGIIIPEPDRDVTESKKALQSKAVKTMVLTHYNFYGFRLPKALKEKLGGDSRSIVSFANIFDPAKKEENIKRIEKLTNREDPKSQMEAAKEIFRTYQTIDAVLFGKQYSDEELLEAFPKIYAASQPLCMELDNFIKDIQKYNIDINDPELSELINTAKANSKAVSPFFTYYISRMKELTNEYYPFIPDGYEHNADIELQSDESLAHIRFEKAFDPSYKNQAAAEMASYLISQKAGAEIESIYSPDGTRFNPKDFAYYANIAAKGEALIFFLKGQAEPVAFNISMGMPPELKAADISLFNTAVRNHSNFDNPVSLDYAKEKYKAAEEKFNKGEIDIIELKKASGYFIAAKKGLTERGLLQMLGNPSNLYSAYDDLDASDIKNLMEQDIDSDAYRNFEASFDIYTRTNAISGTKKTEIAEEEERAWKAYEDKTQLMGRIETYKKVILDTVKQDQKRITNALANLDALPNKIKANTASMGRDEVSKYALTEMNNSVVEPIRNAMASIIVMGEILNVLESSPNISKNEFDRLISSDTIENRKKSIKAEEPFKKLTDPEQGFKPAEYKAFASDEKACINLAKEYAKAKAGISISKEPEAGKKPREKSVTNSASL